MRFIGGVFLHYLQSYLLLKVQSDRCDSFQQCVDSALHRINNLQKLFSCTHTMYLETHKSLETHKREIASKF